MALEDGSYLAKNVKRVVVWKKPDKNGTGDFVEIDDTDIQGRVIGRGFLRDSDGNQVKYYPAPAGFRNMVNSDRRDCWVYTNENGTIYRQPNGEAVNIVPGQAVVFEADGSVTYLNDEYSQYVFANSHDALTNVA